MAELRRDMARLKLVREQIAAIEKERLARLRRALADVPEGQRPGHVVYGTNRTCTAGGPQDDDCRPGTQAADRAVARPTARSSRSDRESTS